MPEKEPTPEDKARFERFVWKEGDLELVGNDTTDLPDDDEEDDDDEEEEDESPS